MSKKVLAGFSWLTFSQGVKVVVSSLVMLWLAKILDAGIFGVFAMANVFVQFFRVLSSTGIDAAVIQSKNYKKDYFFTLNVYLCTVGVFLYLICWLGAPFLADFYNNSEITKVFRVMAISIPLGSLGFVSRGLLLKELKYQKVAISDIISIVFSSIFAVVVAVETQSYWALVVQLITMTALANVLYLLYYTKGKRIPMVFYFSQIKEIVRFGANVLLFNFLNFLSQQLDIILIGKFLGEKETGYYYLAFNIVAKPFGVLIQSFNQSIYPILARVDKKKMAENYKKYTYPFIIVITMGISLYVGLTKALIPVLLTGKWIAIVPLIFFFGVQVVLQSFGSPSGLLFLLSGNPEKQWKFSLFVSVPLKVAGVILGFFLLSGTSTGVIIGVNITAFISMLIGFYLTFKMIGLKMSSYFVPIKSFILLLLLFMVLSEFFGKEIDNIWLQMLYLSVVFVAICWVIFKTNKQHFEEIINLVKKKQV